MSQDALNRIADELEAIRELLGNFLVVPSPPSPLSKKLGAEAITYADDQMMVEQEEEEQRLIALGQLPNPNRTED